MHVVLLGLSHHTAPVEVRERFSFSPDEIESTLREIASSVPVSEIALLSTCNRLELYASCESIAADRSADRLKRAVARARSVPEALAEAHLFTRTDDSAVRHLMRVAGGLDSMILGEDQILGQVRGALRSAQNAGTAGPSITALFQESIACGKRIRTDTALGRGGFSIGHAAVELAGSIFANLSEATVLMLGAGKMSEITVRHLVDNGARRVVVVNRTHARALAMAERVGGRAVPYETLAETLVTADIVIASTASPQPILNRAILQPVVRKRRGRPLFLIDIAVPRDIDPDVSRLDDVFLKNIDDLQAVVDADSQERAADADRAEAITEEHAVRFATWHRGREAAPVIADIRTKLESIRQNDLAQLRAKLPHLSDRDWLAIETATRAMMNRVSRHAAVRLKHEAGNGGDAPADGYDLASAAREIFGLTGIDEGAEKISNPEGGDLDDLQVASMTSRPLPEDER